MIKWAIPLVILNTADALFTYLVISMGIPEANPIMARLMALGMTEFLLVKLVLINVLAILLVTASKTYKVAKAGFLITLGLYSIVFLYHVFNIWQLFKVIPVAQ